MPFTPSHAVVALPFVRTRLVPAAIAAGAMCPDLPLFVRGTGLGYGLTHDLRWLPLTVLVALGMLLVWRCALRPVATELTPAWVACRLPAVWTRGARAALTETFPRAWGSRILLVISLVLGIASHVVWDAFTHEGRLGVQLLPVLAEQWGPLPGYRWLQHGTGIVALVILGVWGTRWLRHRRPRALGRRVAGWVRIAWWVSLPLVLACALVWGSLVAGPDAGVGTVEQLAYLVLPPATALWLAATVVLSVVLQARPQRGAA